MSYSYLIVDASPHSEYKYRLRTEVQSVFLIIRFHVRSPVPLLDYTVSCQKSSPSFRWYGSVSEVQSVFHIIWYHVKSPVRLLDFTVPCQKSSPSFRLYVPCQKSGNRKKYIRPEVVYLRPQLKKNINIYSLDIFVNYFRIQWFHFIKKHRQTCNNTVSNFLVNERTLELMRQKKKQSTTFYIPWWIYIQ
jgi:hypothetical protein